MTGNDTYGRCGKCGKVLTFREWSYGNTLEGVDGRVCYICKKDEWNNRPIGDATKVRCPRCRQVVDAKDYIEADKMCLACVRGLSPVDEDDPLEGKDWEYDENGRPL